MKNKALLITTPFFLMIILTQFTSAFYYYKPTGTEFGFNFQEGFYSRDYRYIDTPYGSYRVYTKPYYKYHDNDDWYEYWRKKQTADWLVNSYDGRYNANSGKSSGKAFGYNFLSSNEPTDFRNIQVYDYRNYYYQDYNSKQDYYYKPQKDSQGFYNWRY